VRLSGLAPVCRASDLAARRIGCAEPSDWQQMLAMLANNVQTRPADDAGTDRFIP